jgi:hypothetical protein
MSRNAMCWRSYYEPATDLIRPHVEALTGSKEAAPTVRIEDADVAVGAHPQILPYLLHQNWQEARQFAKDHARAFQEQGYRPDGLIIKCGESWRRLFEEREVS